MVAATSLALTFDGSVLDCTSLWRVMAGGSVELRDEIVTLRSEVFVVNEFEEFPKGPRRERIWAP